MDFLFFEDLRDILFTFCPKFCWMNESAVLFFQIQLGQGQVFDCSFLFLKTIDPGGIVILHFFSVVLHQRPIEASGLFVDALCCK